MVTVSPEDVEKVAKKLKPIQTSLIEEVPNSPLCFTKDEILNLNGLFSVKVFIFMAIKHDLTNGFIESGDFNDEAIAALLERWYIKKSIHEVRNIVLQLSEKGYIDCAVTVQLSFNW